MSSKVIPGGGMQDFAFGPRHATLYSAIDLESSLCLTV